MAEEAFADLVAAALLDETGKSRSLRVAERVAKAKWGRKLFTYSTVSDWKNGSIPRDGDAVRAFADGLMVKRVPLLEAAGKTVMREDIESDNRLDGVSAESERLQGKEDGGEQPIEVERTADYVVYRVDLPLGFAPCGFMELSDQDDYRTFEDATGVTVALQALGDSMEPYCSQGDFLFAREVGEIRDGDKYVFQVNGGTMCRILKSHDEETVTFQPENGVYPEVTFKRAEVDFRYEVTGKYMPERRR